MGRRKNNKIILLLVLILGLTIGFALISTTLKINGIANLKSNTFDIHWNENSIVETEGSVDANAPASVIDQEKKTISFDAELIIPGDFYEFTVDAKNYGTVDGAIQGINLYYYEEGSSTPSSLPSYLNYTVTYADGTTPGIGDILKVGKSKKYKIRLEFKSTETEMPSNPDNGTVTFKIDHKVTKVVCPNAVSFSNDSWDTIICNVQKGKTDKYNVGDTKTIDLGTLGTHTVRLANKSTPSECSQAGFSQTACGFVVEFEDIIDHHYMGDGNTISNVGGWPATVLRGYLNTDIFNQFPASLKEDMLNTFVVSSHGNRDASDFLSYDKLYLLSRKEIWGAPTDSTQFDTGMDKTRQLDYYQEKGVGLTTNREFVIKKYNDVDGVWWQRSALYSSYESFSTASSWGNYDYDNDTFREGISPAFRLG